MGQQILVGCYIQYIKNFLFHDIFWLWFENFTQNAKLGVFKTIRDETRKRDTILCNFDKVLERVVTGSYAYLYVCIYGYL